MEFRMVELEIDGQKIKVFEGTTLLEAAQFLGIEIPTLCSMEGLSPYGACRLCIVEIGPPEWTRVVSSCTYPCEQGLEVRTNTPALIESRRMLLELMVSSTPDSKVIQDMASAMGVTKQRFTREDEDCVLCGLCVRMCKEQMISGAIDFAGRGPDRHITTPFDVPSDLCRRCGGCMYVCPACQLRCAGAKADTALCGGCLNTLSCNVLETI
jgi:NADH dehydrogenase/NADH:ubiquinone oxidoreductase subunit G